MGSGPRTAACAACPGRGVETAFDEGVGLDDDDEFAGGNGHAHFTLLVQTKVRSRMDDDSTTTGPAALRRNAAPPAPPEDP